jgi:hypothetical protein
VLLVFLVPFVTWWFALAFTHFFFTDCGQAHRSDDRHDDQPFTVSNFI